MLPQKLFIASKIIHPKDILLKHDRWKESGKIEKIILFRVHSCDIYRLQILDNMYLSLSEPKLD